MATSRAKRIFGLLAIGVVATVVALYLQQAPAGRFRARFHEPVVSVILDGHELQVQPYRMEDRADFHMESNSTCDMSLLEIRNVTFVLESGERLDCYYVALNGEIHFTPTKHYFRPVGVGRNLWPETP